MISAPSRMKYGQPRGSSQHDSAYSAADRHSSHARSAAGDLATSAKGLTPRQHAHTARRPWHTLPHPEVCSIVYPLSLLHF